MATIIEATRLAMNAVAEATPAERRQRMVALMDLAVKLQARVTRAQYLDDETPPDGKLSMHEWLVREDRWLTANQSTDQTFLDRETKYLKDVMTYQEACDVLSAAYETVRDASRDPSVPKVKRDVWRQLGEPPF